MDYLYLTIFKETKIQILRKIVLFFDTIVKAVTWNSMIPLQTTANYKIIIVGTWKKIFLLKCVLFIEKEYGDIFFDNRFRIKVMIHPLVDIALKSPKEMNSYFYSA